MKNLTDKRKESTQHGQPVSVNHNMNSITNDTDTIRFEIGCSHIQLYSLLNFFENITTASSWYKEKSKRTTIFG